MSEARKNLKPFDSDRARECGRLGGIKSGESRRARRTLAEELRAILSDGNNQERMCVALYEKAVSGDIKAVRCIADIIGELGAQKVEVFEGRYTEDDLKRRPELKEELLRELEGDSPKMGKRFSLGAMCSVLEESFE